MFARHGGLGKIDADERTSMTRTLSSSMRTHGTRGIVVVTAVALLLLVTVAAVQGAVAIYDVGDKYLAGRVYYTPPGSGYHVTGRDYSGSTGGGGYTHWQVWNLADWNTSSTPTVLNGWSWTEPIRTNPTRGGTWWTSSTPSIWYFGPTSLATTMDFRHKRNVAPFNWVNSYLQVNY